MVCTSLGSLLRPLFYFLCYIHFSLSVQGYSYDQLISWVDLDLGSAPGWWPIL